MNDLSSANERWPEVAIEPGVELPTSCARDPFAFVSTVLESVFSFVGKKISLSIYLCGDREIARIHGDYLEDPTPTDVISFSLTEPDEVQSLELADGELIVGVEFARRSAEAHQNAWEAELALYLVHGCLHLCGYDDRAEPDLAHMKCAERSVIDLLGYEIKGRFDSE